MINTIVEIICVIGLANAFIVLPVIAIWILIKE